MQHTAPEGEILLFNKPLGWSSFDLVKKVRNVLRAKKVGHAGTLDPLATGLMILCTEKQTKKITDLTGKDKEYTGTMRLGQSSPSYDLETKCTEAVSLEGITIAQLEAQLKPFTGSITQRPPAHSAVKVDGKRLYKSARAGIEVEIPTREVEIFAFEITAVALPEVHFRVHCSKGTYIRSLVHDYGQALGVGAVLTALCRTAIGHYRLNEAWDLANFVAEKQAQKQADAGIQGT